MARTGTDVTLTPAIYHATLGPGGQATLGFPGTSSGPTFQPPTGFTANDAPCAQG